MPRPKNHNSPPNIDACVIDRNLNSLPRNHVDGACVCSFSRASRSPSTACSFASECPIYSRASIYWTSVYSGGNRAQEVPSDSTPVFTSRVQSQRFRSTFPVNAFTALYVCSLPAAGGYCHRAASSDTSVSVSANRHMSIFRAVASSGLVDSNLSISCIPFVGGSMYGWVQGRRI
jgi:hypothetical protein